MSSEVSSRSRRELEVASESASVAPAVLASDAELAALREKLSSADNRERILSQHLLDNQNELAEIHIKHEKELLALNAKLVSHAVSSNKLEMLYELIRTTAVAVSSVSGNDILTYKQQSVEALAVNKTFLEDLPIDEKVNYMYT